MPLSKFLRRVPRWVLEWPSSLALVALVGLAIRIPLGLHSPPFVDQDTRQYLKAAFSLLAGEDFALPLVRTPGYPVFLTVAMWLVGPDFKKILMLQHVVGVGVALLTADIARMLYGRLVGTAAGLLMALSAPLLISEHYLMTETVFTLVLMAACWMAVCALRRDRDPWWPFVVTGILFGLAALTRPVAQILFGVPALMCLIDGRGWRRTLRVAGLVGIGGALTLCPWMAYNLARHGVFELTHRTGDSLITHISLYANKRYAPLPPGDALQDPQRAAARRLVNDAIYGSQAKARSMSGPRIADELERKLGLSPVAADDLLRELALEQIRAQPWTYLSLLLENAQRVYVGRPADLQYAWETPASAQWGSGLPIHPEPATEHDYARLELLDTLVRIYDPAHLAFPIALLFTIGFVQASVDRGPRLALLPALVAMMLLVAAVGLIGTEYRFRYPVDPLITIVALGGLRCLILGLASLAKPVFVRETQPAAPSRPEGLPGTANVRPG